MVTNPAPDTELTNCPKCGAVQELPGACTVFRAEDSEKLAALFKGEINLRTCRECSAKFLLKAPLVFRDDAKRFLVYYMPLGDSDNSAEAEKQMIDLTRELFGDDDEEMRPTCRLTVTRRRFIEKIALHIHELNDRLVEYIKFQLYNRKEEPIDPVRFELLYDFSDSEADKLAFIVYDRETNQPTAAAHLPREVYDDIEATFGTTSSLSEELDMLFPGYVVNADRLL